MTPVIGYFLIVVIIGAYLDRIVKAYLQAIAVRTGSKGIKTLPYQQWNPTWQKYVVPMIRN